MHERHPEADTLDEILPTLEQLKAIADLARQLAEGGDSHPWVDGGIVRQYDTGSGELIEVSAYPPQPFQSDIYPTLAEVKFTDTASGVYKLCGVLNAGPDGLASNVIIDSDSDYEERSWTGAGNNYESMDEYMTKDPVNAWKDMQKMMRDSLLDERVNRLTYKSASEVIEKLQALSS